MIHLGITQKLYIIRETSSGAYLAASSEEKDEAVLLPGGQIPKDAQIGDRITVFIYKDSKDRLIATTASPRLELGGLALLTVSDVTKIGAFLDWGLPKDLFLPFKEQTYRPNKGDSVLVTLYIDKSERLCATMHVYERLNNQSPYHTDDQVEGLVYEVSSNFGAFVAVDHLYSALIPKKELFTTLKPGQKVKARVTRVLEDGRLNLSLREKTYLQLDKDAEHIFAVLQENGGSMLFHDKSPAEEIRLTFQLSKNAFKRGLGHLLKEGRILLDDTHIEIKHND